MKGINMVLDFKISNHISKRNGEDKEKDMFLIKVCDVAKLKEYSSQIKWIDFIPVILEQKILLEGIGKEFKKIEMKYGMTTIGK